MTKMKIILRLSRPTLFSFGALNYLIFMSSSCITHTENTQAFRAPPDYVTNQVPWGRLWFVILLILSSPWRVWGLSGPNNIGLLWTIWLPLALHRYTSCFCLSMQESVPGILVMFSNSILIINNIFRFFELPHQRTLRCNLKNSFVFEIPIIYPSRTFDFFEVISIY